MKNLSSNIQVIISLIVCLMFCGSLFGQASIYSESPIIENAHSPHQMKVKVNGDFKHCGNFEGTAKISSSQNYRYTSIFEKDLTPEIEAVLIQELGEPSVVSKNIKRWNHIDGEKVKDFQIMLRDGKVKIIYKNGTQKIMKQLNIVTKAICKITYKSNCD